jgi:hypothetical protein
MQNNRVTKKLLITIFKNNKKILKEQTKLVNKYQELSKKQENQEKWIRLTRYLAFGFILVRISLFCYSNIFLVT